jgi:hypothetical protein
MKRPLLILFAVMSLVYAASFFAAAPVLARPCPGSGDWEDQCFDDPEPTGPIVESLGTEKTVEAGLSSDGDDKEGRLYLFTFPGNAGQLYKLDLMMARNDDPSPGVEFCVNNSSRWGDGVCRTAQQWKGGSNLPYQNPDIFRVNPDDYTYYSHLVVRLSVDQTAFNENDVVTRWKMYRREFSGIKNASVETDPIAPGDAPVLNWSVDGASSDPNNYIGRSVMFMEGPGGATGFWNAPSQGPWTADVLSALGRYDYHLEISGPARYGGEYRDEEDFSLNVTSNGSCPGGNCGPGGACNNNNFCDGDESQASCPNDCPPPGGTGRFKCTGTNQCTFVADPGEANLPDQCNSGNDCGPAGGSCGDGAINPGEDCDDGGANGPLPAACSNSCTVNATVCGNGTREGAEECDQGGSNGNPPAACSSACTWNPSAQCGDGNIDPGEQCDNGASNGACPNTCSATCRINNSCTPADCSQLLSATYPASVGINTSFPVSATFMNCGTNVWTPPPGGQDINTSVGYKLGDPADGGGIWGLVRVGVPNAVPPGQQVTISFNATAPSTTGLKNWNWRMVNEFVRWFGDGWNGQIEVRDGAPGTPSPNGLSGASNCTLAPTYTGQGTISWTGTPNPAFGFYLDISTDPNFATFYNKNVPSGTQTDTSGFVLNGGNQPLVLETDRTYYTRVYNGFPTVNDHSPTANFLKPYCRQNVCDTSGVVSQCVSIIGNGANSCSVSGDCPPPPPRCTMSANPNRLVIPPPATSRIDWSCTNATSCTLTSFGAVPTSGQRTVAPTSTKTYTLNCTGVSGSDTIDIQVRLFNQNASGTIKEIPPR